MLIERENYLVAAKVVERFDQDVVNFGDKIHMPWVTDMTATEVVEGNDVTYQANTETEATITIDQMWEVSFLVHDKYKAQSAYAERTVSEKIKKAAHAIGKKIDTSVLAKYAQAGSYVGDGNTDITKENIILANQKLDEADCPMDDRHFIVNAAGRADLLLEDDFIRFDATGKVSPMVAGGKGGYNFGDILDVTVHVSNNVPVEAATPSVVHGLFLHKEAIGLALQKNISFEKQRKAEKLSDLYVTTALWGVATLRPDHMVDFRYKA